MLERPGFIRRHSVWVFLSVILAVTVLLSLYVFLEFNINQTMYLEKANLNWFQTVFYSSSVFYISAFLALCARYGGASLSSETGSLPTCREVVH